MATTASYHPSEHVASHFWESQFSKEVPQSSVPSGFPSKLVSPLAWTRDEIEAKRSEWILKLGQDDIESLEAALASFAARSVNLSDISQDTFPLPGGLAQRLRQVSHQIYDGVGLNVIQGLDPSRYTEEQNVIIYAGMAAYVAPQRGFLDRGATKVLCHVVNALGEKAGAINKTPGFTNGPLSFHSDMCEILSLYALDLSSEGGKTLVSSAWQVYNELAVRRPDILQTLADNWVLDTFQDYSKYPPVSVPFIYNTPENKVVWRFSRYPVTGFAERTRNPALPALTKAQIEAIDAVHFIAAANAVPLPMSKGDMVFINDMAILHARERFSEGGVFLQRHLLKFYLRDPEKSWQVPSQVLEPLMKIYGPNSDNGLRKEIWSPKFKVGQEDGWASNG